MKEKNDAVATEHLANQRVEEFVRCITVAGSVAFGAVLIADSLVVRHRMQRQHIDAAMQAVELGNLSSEMKEQIAHRLGRNLPRFSRNCE